MCIHNGLLCFRPYDTTACCHLSSEKQQFVVICMNAQKPAMNLCKAHNTRRNVYTIEKKNPNQKGKKRFTIKVYIMQDSETESKEYKGTEKQKVDITHESKLELCKLLWYNMGQRKKAEKKGSEKGMTEKKTGTETGEENRAITTDNAVKRDEKGRWLKGSSGNVSGRKPMPFSVRQTLLDMLPKALQTVQSIIDDENAKDDVRLRASELVIERNLGKSVTPVLTETVGKDSSLTLSEMIACARDLLESGDK